MPSTAEEGDVVGVMAVATVGCAVMVDAVGEVAVGDKGLLETLVVSNEGDPVGVGVVVCPSAVGA